MCTFLPIDLLDSEVHTTHVWVRICPFVEVLSK